LFRFPPESNFLSLITSQEVWFDEANMRYWVYVVVLGLICLSHSAWAENGEATRPEYFVASDIGDDAHPGTSPETPFKTIKKAVSQAEGGSIITVMPGKYDETRL